MSNLPPGLEPETPVNTSLPPGLVADVGAEGRKAKLEAQTKVEKSSQPGAVRRFLQGLGVPTSKDEFLAHLQSSTAMGALPYSPLTAAAGALGEDHSYEGINRVVNPMAPLMENVGSGNYAGALGNAVPLLAGFAAGSGGGPKAPMTEPIPVPAPKAPTSALGRVGRATYEMIVPKPIKAAKALLGMESGPESGAPSVSNKRAFGYREATDPLKQHVFDPDNLIRRPSSGNIYDPPSNFEGPSWQSFEAAYGNAPTPPNVSRGPITVNDLAPTYIRGAMDESVPGATDISPAPISLDALFGQYGDSPAQTNAGRFVNPFPNDTAPLNFEPGTAGSTVTQGMTPPLGPADLQGIRGQTNQMMQGADILGEGAVAGFSPAQFQQLLQYLSQIPDEVPPAAAKKQRNPG